MRLSIIVSLACIAGALSVSSVPAAAEKRVALVIGNSTYKHVAPLANPSNDAKLMARTLRGLGFALVGGGAQLDLDKPALDRVVQKFGAMLQGADVGLFYYAGHGVGVHGSNYLVPIDANPTRLADVDFQMLDTNLVLRQMEGAGTRLNLVILDACRNNPFKGRGLRAAGGGLAQMDAPEGTLISFATQPGAVAQDGAGGDSPYTTALTRTMREPGVGLFEVFNQVGLKVQKATGGSQKPWQSSSPISGSFYFNPHGVAAQPEKGGAPAGSGSGNIEKGLAAIQQQLDELARHKDTAAPPPTQIPAPASAPAPQTDAANRAWLAIKGTQSQAILRAYINRFPKTVYADFARARLAELERNTPPPAPPPVRSTAPVNVLPSFPCSDAHMPAEITICRTADLAKMDVQLDGLYHRIRGRLTSRNRRLLARSQRAWLDQRNACRYNVSCLQARYSERIRYLGSRY